MNIRDQLNERDKIMAAYCPEALLVESINMRCYLCVKSTGSSSLLSHIYLLWHTIRKNKNKIDINEVVLLL